MIYSSENNQYHVSLSNKSLDEILKHIKKSRTKETGGILIGAYNDDHSTAVVKTITGAPPDSKHGATWFERGLKGLQKLINSLWSTGEYYLGEWHFHPNASPSPSFQDITQMKIISESIAYRCPEPVLLIIGGDYINYSIRVFLSIRENNFIELNEINISK
jgi:integrative and conjugative element protein (TIGR02256 family)